MKPADYEFSEAGMIRRRLDDLRGRGGRSEYRFNPEEDLEGRPPIFYLPGELVTTAAHAEIVHELLEEWHGKCEAPRPLTEGDPDIVVFRIEGDSLHVATAIKQAAAKLPGVPTDLAVAPHHVLTPAPQPKIGPGDDPVPASDADRSTRGPATKAAAPVAVVDTGLWTDPANNLIATSLESPAAAETVDGDSDGFVDYHGSGHGGFIAGVIENNAPGVKIVAHNAFGPHGLTEASVISEVDKALAAHDLLVVNLSLGSYEKDDAGCERIELVALRSAMRRWRDKHPGALLVAAAGNDGKPHPFYPAGFAGEAEFADMVVSVGALQPAADEPGIHTRAATFTNYGPWVTAWAPGVKVVSEYPDDMKFGYLDAAGNPAGEALFGDGLAAWSGTSFAAPFVAAEIVREMREGESPRQTWARLRGASPFVVFWPSW